ncbi:MAG: pyridoxal phosphate-dependent aminotransferase, partial [Gemmatimonadota bacterium]
SLEDPEMVGRSLDVNERSRAILHACLDQLRLEYLPSHTNFVMHRIPGELTTYIERMREAGFRVGRPFPPMLEWNRVSLGLPEEMERFAETLGEFRGKGWV